METHKHISFGDAEAVGKYRSIINPPTDEPPVEQNGGVLHNIDESDTVKISDRLRQAIERSRKTVYRIAEETGINQSVLSRFLSGERDIRLETADLLAENLKLELKQKKRRKKSA